MENQLIDLINKISNYLVTLAPEIYKVYYTHVILNGIGKILGATIAITFILLLIYKVLVPELKNGESLKDTSFTFVLIIAHAFALMFLPVIYDGIRIILNPNYYIIQEFIKMVK